MLKEMGRSKKSRTIVKCPNEKCRKKLDIDELIEEGYLEKLANVSMYTCPFCDTQWQEK